MLKMAHLKCHFKHKVKGLANKMYILPFTFMKGKVKEKVKGGMYI